MESWAQTLEFWNQAQNPDILPLRSLRDLQKIENFFPGHQIRENVNLFKQFMENYGYEIDILSAIKLSQIEFPRPVNGKINLSDLLLILFRSRNPGDLNPDDFKLLTVNVRELLCLHITSNLMIRVAPFQRNPLDFVN